MQTRITTIIAAGFMVFLQPLAADTIALKNGEKINGSIIREDGEHYVVEVFVSGTIKDERRIARADVKYIEKEKEDERNFAELGITLPTPDLMEKEAYEEWMAKLEEFVKSYPDSPKAQIAKETIDVLGDEHAIIAAGGIKFGGEMVSGGDYEANAYEYDARMAEKRIKDAVARRDFISSLRLYSDYCEKFGESEGRDGIDALMLQVLAAYKANLDENLATLESRLEKRKSGLASMAVEDRLKTERALEEQLEMINARFAKEKSSGQKWVTPESFHKESMDEALRQVTGELSRLQIPRKSTPIEKPLAESYRIAWDKLGAEIPPVTEAAVGEADAAILAAIAEQNKLAADAVKEKKAILEQAKSDLMPEFYLEKLRIRAELTED